MKNISNHLKKIDRWVLDRLTEYVRRWIKKHDYEKHKVDFTIEVQKVKVVICFVFALALPVVMYFLNGRYLQAGFHAMLWSISVGIYYFQLQNTIHKEKPEHDHIFSLRKNPAVYEMEKSVLEYVFIHRRKQRLSFIAFDFSMAWFLSAGVLALFLISPSSQPLSSLGIYFFISPVIHTLEQYLIFVFDFDEPEEKKKVVKESITQILLQAWQNLIGGLFPQPNYG